MEVPAHLVERLEKHRAATGMAPEHVLEQAVHQYLAALDALPADVVIPTRLVVAARGGEAILRNIENALPSEGLVDLLRDGD